MCVSVVFYLRLQEIETQITGFQFFFLQFYKSLLYFCFLFSCLFPPALWCCFLYFLVWGEGLAERSGQCQGWGSCHIGPGQELLSSGWAGLFQGGVVSCKSLQNPSVLAALGRAGRRSCPVGIKALIQCVWCVTIVVIILHADYTHIPLTRNIYNFCKCCISLLVSGPSSRGHLGEVSRFGASTIFDHHGWFCWHSVRS